VENQDKRNGSRQLFAQLTEGGDMCGNGVEELKQGRL
jgi:hypothetical protein